MAQPIKNQPAIQETQEMRRPMRWLEGISNSMDMNVSKLLETVEDRGA